MQIEESKSQAAQGLACSPASQSQRWLLPFLAGLAATVVGSYLLMEVLGLRFLQPFTCTDMLKVRFFQEQVSHPAIVYLGNSQMHYGVMPPVVAEALAETRSHAASGFSLALPGAPLEISLILARDLLKARHQPKVLLLSVLPLIVGEGGHSEPDLLFRFGNLADIVQGVEDGQLRATDILAGSFRGVENLLQAPFERMKKPIRAYRWDHLQKSQGGWWAREDIASAQAVKPEIWQRMLDKLGQPKSVQFQDGSRPARTLRAFRDLAEERGMQLVLVYPPQHPDACERLQLPGTEALYHAWIVGFCQRQRIGYWDLNEPGLYEHADFADPVHLNARGADKFSTRLAEKLVDLPHHTRTPNQVQ